MSAMTAADIQLARTMPPDHPARAIKRRLYNLTMAAREPLELLFRSQPDFVKSKNPEPLDHIPVFFLHSVEPDEFEKRLQYLAENDYTTLSLDDLHGHMTGSSPAPPRSVVLTFDDGRLSVWQYAGPLLKKYDMRAAVFVIAGYVSDADAVRPNLADVWAGQCKRDALDDNTDIGPAGLMNWAELRALAADGHIAVESHTLYHRRVFTGSKLVDFCTPAFPDEFHDLPLPTGTEQRWLSDPIDIPYGLPLYQYGPLSSAQRIYRDDEAVRQACLDLVRDGGGAEFFKHSDWRRKLISTCRPPSGTFFGQDAIADEMTRDFAEAREIIRANIPNCKAAHLCYPYGAGSDAAADIARRVGYQTGTWLRVPGRTVNRAGDDPHRIVRLKHDWILRLPGRSRRTMREIFSEKAARRMPGRRYT